MRLCIMYARQSKDVYQKKKRKGRAKINGKEKGINDHKIKQVQLEGCNKMKTKLKRDSNWIVIMIRVEAD